MPWPTRYHVAELNNCGIFLFVCGMSWPTRNPVVGLNLGISLYLSVWNIIGMAQISGNGQFWNIDVCVECPGLQKIMSLSLIC